MSSRLIVNSIRHTGASSDAITLDSAGKVAFPNTSTGKILQVKNYTRTDTVSEQITGYGIGSSDVLTLSLTAASTSNRLLFIIDVNVSVQDVNESCGIVLHSGGSVISTATGDAASNRSRITSGGFIGIENSAFTNIGMNYYHTPANTNATTYQVRFYNGDADTRYMYANRAHVDTDTAGFARTISSMTILEVAA